MTIAQVLTFDFDLIQQLFYIDATYVLDLSYTRLTFEAGSFRLGILGSPIMQLLQFKFPFISK